MATTSGTNKRTRSSGSTRSATKRPTAKSGRPSSAKSRTSGSAKPKSGATASASRTTAKRSNSESRSPGKRSSSATNGSVRERIVGGALGAIVGGAAVGGVSRLANHYRRPRVMGIRIPDELNPRHLDTKKLAGNIDIKGVLRKVGNAAEQIEERSDDVRALSAQAKRLTRKLS